MREPSNEQRYFDALRVIATAVSADDLRRKSERLYGLEYAEALEMAHDNIVDTAKHAIERRRRPRQ